MCQLRQPPEPRALTHHLESVVAIHLRVCLRTILLINQRPCLALSALSSADAHSGGPQAPKHGHPRYLCEHCKEEIGKQKFSSEDDEQVEGKNPGRPAIYWPTPFVFSSIQSRGHAVTPAVTRTDSEGSQDCRPDPVH